MIMRISMSTGKPQFLYICANPFIYATKFDPVKRALVGLFLCKQDSQPDGTTLQMA